VPYIDSFTRKAEFLGNTSEFRRIRDIPRRVWSDEESARLAVEMTRALRTKEGEQELRPHQAVSLHDIAQDHGLLGPLRVGSGKSLISFLAPYVVGARNPLLMLPAGMIGETVIKIKDAARHWKVPRNIELLSYEMCAGAAHAERLTKKHPDLLILDEAHKAKNRDAGVTKRVLRLLRQYPETWVIILTGSLSTWSLLDWAHLGRMSLKDRAMIPDNEGELQEWADALDQDVPFNRRLDPGPLLSLATAEDLAAGGGDELTVARLAFRRRMAETSGVVFTSGESVASSLYVRELPLACNDVTEAHYKHLRTTWERPDGWAHEEAMHVWKTARELALGFCYVWDPHPPDPWLDARRAWAKFVRDTLAHSRTLDTPGQVKTAVLEERLEDGGILGEWLRIEPTFTPRLKAVWHDDTALKTCEKWIKDHREGIVWCEHTWFAEELSRRTGKAYHGRKGLDSKGRFIADASGVIIASIAANGVGRNLQKWHEGLIVSPPTTSTGNEQLIGRKHRDGQKADTVEFDILLGCFEHWDAIHGAREQARAERDMMPGSDQAKLLIADVSWPTEQAMMARAPRSPDLPGYRWMRTADAVKMRKGTSVVEMIDALDGGLDPEETEAPGGLRLLYKGPMRIGA
jgi:hypothetical protein